MRRKPNTWTDSMVHSELIPICAATGMFPSNSELVRLGRGDLANQICKRGGFVAWSAKLGYERNGSDSDFGWSGERRCMELLQINGFVVEKADRLRAPFDILINGCIRVDVKTANYAEYGVCRGWFYRIGKHAQSDFVLLLQLDTDTLYCLPWQVCPTTNITISREGGIYVKFKNNFDLLRETTKARIRETFSARALMLPRKQKQEL